MNERQLVRDLVGLDNSIPATDELIEWIQETMDNQK